MTDASAQLKESATYCRPNDEKRPAVVGLPDITTTQVCPTSLSEQAPEVTNAYPDGWYVRVMFDELLDPSIETLTPVLDDTGMPTGASTGSIAASHPAKLECEGIAGGMVNIDYDGYYSPSGNRVTWPVGPSLVFKPNSPKLVATNTNCQITLADNILDKDGNPVPVDERGPFKFKVAPIQVIAIDPSDDAMYANPIPAQQIYFDNPYLQFNTAVNIDSLCPDAGGDGLCDGEGVFSITDNAHPNEGPGACNVTGKACGSMADCSAQMGDTACGRGLCTSTTEPTGGSGAPCNKLADCDLTGATPDDACSSNYAYSYEPFGFTPAEFGAGPVFPVETDHKYTMQLTSGAKLKDRCGRDSILGAPSVDDLTLVHFVTDTYKFSKTSIVTGETAAPNKRLVYYWNNQISAVPDATAGQITISPMPQKMTAACAAGGAGCPVTDLVATDLVKSAFDLTGMFQLDGMFKLDTQYTATLKAGVQIPDAFGKMWTNPMDMVVTWKTAPAIVVSSMSLRNVGAFVGTGDKGTLVKPTPTTQQDIRIGFNQTMDPTTLDLTDIDVQPAVAGLALGTPSGCAVLSGTGANPANHLGTCTLRVRGTFSPGTYKITLKAGAAFKDVFGVAYTQAKDQTITVIVAEAPAVARCL